jgi:hypothetical protein
VQKWEIKEEVSAARRQLMLCSRQFWETDSGLPFLRVAKLSPPLDIGYPRSLRLLIPPSFVAFAASTRLDTQPAISIERVLHIYH